MPLLNYTTTVSANKSIAAIQKALAKAGASALLHEFDDNGNIMALSFRIKMPSPDAGGAVHADVHFWNKFLERVKGDITEFLQGKLAVFNDHAITNYVANTEKNLQRDPF